jgi:integrase
MVAGHLHEKNGYYYIILNLTDANGKRKPKWISTKLPVKGNKKRAEQLLMEERKRYSQPTKSKDDDILFADFMEQWLDVVKGSITTVTYSSYANMVKVIIAPYFREKNITLKGLQAKDIQDFYQEQLNRVKASTVIHYHANIHKALKYAVKLELISNNPADRVERPKQEKFQGSFYSSEELNDLFDAVAGTRLELAVLLGAFYGLRRSEIVGLKWDAIDFKKNTITINHTVTSCNLDGKCVVLAKDTTKTKSSRRTLPLVPFFRDKLLNIKSQQEANKKLCGRSYNKDYLDYIYVDEIGDRIKPNYITGQFPKLLEKQGFRRIRFHDLRHSCASLLLASGVPMKNIQEWLGHSDFSTTANIYAHLDYSSKLTSASAMESNFRFQAQ